MEIKSIHTKKIYKNIVEQIVHLICEGSLRCGDKLPPERTLAEMLNVSRASLREALSVMEIMGIVDIKPGEGSFVSDLNVQPFISLMLPLLLKEEDTEKDLLEFRKMLEISEISMIADDLDPSEPLLENLEKLLRQMEIYVDDAERGAKLDIAFHKCLFSLSSNKILIIVLDYVDFILERAVNFNRNKLLGEGENAKILLKQHRDIYDALISKNSKLAAEKMGIHLNYVNERTRNS